jgi:flagellar basal-body rod protein FlgG
MIRGWYIGASGMNAQQNRLDAISNNLANVDTAGFKRDVAVSKSFSELFLRRINDDGVYPLPRGTGDVAPIIGKIGLGVETNEVYTIFEQGQFKETASTVDIALDGQGFVAIQTPQGERYTRNGAFKLGKEGILETKDGYPVLGEQGLIRLEDDRFYINQNGIILAGENREPLDRLRIVRFDNERYLEKQGTSFYRDTIDSGLAFVAQEDQRPKVMQGFLETSNVNVVNEMVQMIEVNRAYEANQKTVQSEDSMMDTLWNRVAVLR